MHESPEKKGKKKMPPATTGAGRPRTEQSPEVEAWLAENPIRIWQRRYPQRRTLNRVAEFCGCNRQTVYFWLDGESVPRVSLMRKLAELLGVDYERLEVRWRRWWVRRPKEQP